MKQDTLLEPHGYVYQARLFEDIPELTWRLWLWANFVALIPLGMAVCLIWLPYQYYLSAGAPLLFLPNPTWPPRVALLATLLTILISIPFHELLHGVAFLTLGYTPRFYFEGGYPAAGITPGSFITRRHYLIVSLLPVTVMSLVGGFLLPFLPPAIGRPIVWALLLNAAASIGDLLVAQRLWRCPAHAVFAEQQGIRVFVPARSDNLQSPIS